MLSFPKTTLTINKQELTMFTIVIFILSMNGSKVFASPPPTNLTLEMKLATLWENKSNQIELEKQMSIKLIRLKDQQFEYSYGMTKIFVQFNENNKKLVMN